MHCIAVHSIIGESSMNENSVAWRANARWARSIWGRLSSTTFDTLRQLTKRLGLSVAAGDLQLLENRLYVTHSGLLHIAQRRRCFGIKTAIEDRFSDPLANRWVFKATVYKSPSSRGFVGYGDADPSNVSPLVLGAEMRVAETRAVNRALRKAYGIGLCSVEELGWLAGSSGPTGKQKPSIKPPNSNGSSNGQPRLTRPAVSPNSPVQSRPQIGQGVRRRLLRHADPQRRQSRVS